jgi:hypothetical protein
VLFGCIAAAVYIFVEFWDELGHPWGPEVSAFLAFSCFALHVTLSHRRVSAVDPIIWVPVVMLIFFFGVPTAVGLFGEPATVYDTWQVGLSPSLSRGYCTALLSLVCFLWGIQLTGLVDLSRIHPRSPDQSLALPGVIMTIGGCVMFTVGIVVLGPSAVFGRYQDFWDAMIYGGDQRLLGIGGFFLQGGIFAIIASYDRRRRGRTALALLGSMLLGFVFLQVGQRTSVMSLLIGFGWCYSQRVRRVPFALTIPAAALVLVLMPIIGQYRADRRLDEHRSVTQLASAALLEMGGSSLAFAYTLDYIPSTKDYTYGLALLEDFLDLVPNFGLTKGGGKIHVGLTSETQLSAWITKTLEPNWYANGGGLGTALGAEWYFYFGMPGVVAGMALLGYMMTRFRNASQSSALGLVGAALVFVGTAAAVRSEMGVGLKMVAWPVLGLWVIKSALRKTAVPVEDLSFPAREPGEADRY